MDKVIQGVLVTVIILGSGYLVYSFVVPVLDTPEAVEVVTFVDDVEEIDVSDWQTYRNEEFGFEFEYPDDWYHGGGPRGESQFLICLNPRGVAGDCIGLVTVSSNIDLDELYNARKKLFEKYKVVESETTISGVQAKMLAVSGYKEGREGFSRELFFEYESLVYNISLVYGKEDIFDHITESFKILTN